MNVLLRAIKIITNGFTQGKRSVKNVIIQGVDYPSYELASALAKHPSYNVVAFIDEEPWTNKTEMLGATLHYPSDIAALIERHHVQAYITFDEESLKIDMASNTHVISLNPKSDLDQQIQYLTEKTTQRNK